MTTAKTAHLQATIDYVEHMIRGAERDGRPQEWVTSDGAPVSYADAIDELMRMRADGMHYVPCDCDCDSRGRCPGWAAEEETK